jgi:hypothetical protein
MKEKERKAEGQGDREKESEYGRRCPAMTLPRWLCLLYREKRGDQRSEEDH